MGLGAELLAGVVALYLGALFFVAHRGDAQPEGHVSRHQPLIFTLSLTVYCTSWTFYGAVGNAAQGGLSFFAIYLGPILVFLLFHSFLKKLLSVSKRQKSTTIADFIAGRYGKSHQVAAVVTLIALVGTLPYISLQIKAIANAYDALAPAAADPGSLLHNVDTALVLTLILAAFAVLFGARTIDASVHHRGMIHAISVESMVKLVAFLAIAGLAVQLLRQAAAGSSSLTAFSLMLLPFHESDLDGGFITRTLLAAAAILCLPRQFHVFAVEGRGNELPFARWGFPLYLLLFSLAVVPITGAGLQRFAWGGNPDLYVLFLPLQSGHDLLTLLAYLGGFSAATGMVIVSTLALSTMVSNDLIFPLMVRWGRQAEGRSLHCHLLLIRRLTILGLMLLAYGYYLLAGSGKSLYSIGLLSFAAAIQFLPALVGGLYWRRGHRHGVVAGLIAGFALWLYLLLLPSLGNAAWLPSGFLTEGPFGLQWLAPRALFGWHFDDYLSHGVFWSLGANLLLYVLVSLRADHSFVDRLQASSYVDLHEAQPEALDHRLRVGDLAELCSRFTGEERTRQFFLEHGCDPVREQHQRAGDRLLRQAQHLLAGSIGTASAEHLIDTALRGSLDRDGERDLYRLLDTAGQALQFNREILQVTLDHIGQAVSVVDPDLRLMTWNRLYSELFAFPADFLHVGMPIEEVIRFNVQRGFGPVFTGPLDAEVRKRLDYLRHGRPYTYVREWRDGRIIQTQGARLPDGGFITTFTDITAIKQAERELARVNERLESQVEARTRRLSELNARLEESTRSKSRFLAAASHDLTQPLGASKLYLGALYEDLAGDERQLLARNALDALASAESLLRALLDISKLDAGAMRPEVTAFPIQPLFDALYNEFSVLARQKGLNLRIHESHCGTRSDRNLLRSILQNFLSNAIRYTEQGTILVVCRRAGPDAIRIEVRDSGRGIPPDKLEAIFREFQQLDHNAEGVGLGLAICERMAELLGHRLEVRSREGVGSTFSVVVPRVQVQAVRHSSVDTRPFKTRWLEGRRILCVDDDPEILRATRTVLERWGAEVLCENSAEGYLQRADATVPCDIVLMDYRLHEMTNGLDLLHHYRARHGERFLGVLITAEQDARVRESALAAGFQFLAKPVEPAKLRSILHTALTQQEQARAAG
ncbi:MAG: sensor histidine kinase [Gammaproteobacteria bacterium]|nr:MAG: sensor histidine kinase [Gammaproteobacteria bacterium]